VDSPIPEDKILSRLDLCSKLTVITQGIPRLDNDLGFETVKQRIAEMIDEIEQETESLLIDLLHALKDVESDHWISATCGVHGSTPHSEGPGSIPRELSFPPSL
jgi:hypothetical protein